MDLLRVVAVVLGVVCAVLYGMGREHEPHGPSHPAVRPDGTEVHGTFRVIE